MPVASEQAKGKKLSAASVLAAGICAALLAFFAVTSYKAAYHKSATVDEPVHFLSAWAALHYGDYRCDPEHPPLWKYWAVAGTRASDMYIDLQGKLAADMLGNPTAQGHLAKQTLYDPRNDADALLRPARARMLALAVALGAIVGLWAWRLAGPIAAIAATALFCFDPNFMAHSPLVKNDVAIALGIVLLLFSVWLLGRRITLARAAAVCICLVVVLTIKLSGVLMIPVLAILLLCRAMFRQPWPALRGDLAGRWQRLAAASIIFIASLLVSWLGIWACYRFQSLPTPTSSFDLDNQALIAVENEILAAGPSLSPQERTTMRQTRRAGALFNAMLSVERQNLLPQTYLVGLMFTYANSRLRPGNLLLGKVHALGSWDYFPLAMAFKTPLATLAAVLAALAVGVAVIWRARKLPPAPATIPWAWTALCLALPPAFYMAWAMNSALNIGLRYVLAVYPFAFIAVGAAAAWAWGRHRLTTIFIAVPLVLILALENITAYPDYIPFFNLAAGGQRGGLRLLGDSNLDWGQDLPALADWQRHNPGTPLLLDYFGAGDPRYYRIRYFDLDGSFADPDLPSVPAGPAIAAVSATQLQKTYTPQLPDEIASSVQGHEPVAVLGGSIYLYSVTLPQRPDVWLAAIPATVVRAVTSRNGLHLAWVTSENGKQRVAIDGRPEPAYDVIGESGPIVSADGKHLAYAASSGGQWRVIDDGKPGAAYDAIGGLVFSPDGKHLAYAAKKGPECFVVMDEQPGPRCDGIGDSGLLFSPDGKRLAYTAVRGGKQLVVVDGQPGAEYNAITKGSLLFSPDGSRVGYVAGKGDQWRLVVDGQPGPAYDAVNAPIFSPDGKRVAYLAAKVSMSELVSGQPARQFVVADGQPSQTYDAIAKGTLIFSPGGDRLTYAARISNRWRVVVDGQPGPECDGVGNLVFSPDGTRLAYLAGQGGKQLVMLDATPGPQYDAIANSTVRFSPDGKHLAYVAGTGGRCRLVVDGQPGPIYDAIADAGPIFSPDSQRVAYRAANGCKQFVVVDGKPGPAYDAVGEGTLIFSPDGKRFAYAATTGGRWRVVVDGLPGPEYDAIAEGSPIFSPDGKRVAYKAGKDSKQLIVVDGQPGPEYERIVRNGPQFDAADVAEYLAIKDAALYRVRCAPAQ